MPYTEWIRRGCYPAYHREFAALSPKEARHFFRMYVDAIPARMTALEALIAERRPRTPWTPNFTEEAFRVATEVLTESIEPVPMAKAELEMLLRDRPQIFKDLDEPFWTMEVSDRTLSIAFDVGIYFAQDMMSKEPRLFWKLDSARTSMTRNQPTLRAPNITRKPPFLVYHPIEHFVIHVGRCANNDPHQYTLLDNYRYWMESIEWYQRENP